LAKKRFGPTLGIIFSVFGNKIIFETIERFGNAMALQ
jgi:hypothetical protein